MNRCRDPRVGVVVLTYNRVDQTTETIERLQALDEQPSIVVVDNASQDGTPAILRARFPEVDVISLDQNMGAAGRNFGVAASDRRYVALCDDDTWWESGALRYAANVMDDYPDLAVLTARVLVGEECRLDPTCAAMARSPVRATSPLPGPALLGFLAGASIIRRSAFLEVGGFEPALFLGAEESLLGIDLVQAGWTMAYLDNLVVHHHPSPLRDNDRRRRLLARNTLLITWLRRPLLHAGLQTVQATGRALGDRSAAGALADALR